MRLVHQGEPLSEWDMYDEMAEQQVDTRTTVQMIFNTFSLWYSYLEDNDNEVEERKEQEDLKITLQATLKEVGLVLAALEMFIDHLDGKACVTSQR
jgi:hypothetical protein